MLIPCKVGARARTVFMDQGRRGLPGGMLGLFSALGAFYLWLGCALFWKTLFLGTSLWVSPAADASVVFWAPFDACPLSPWRVGSLCAITPL